MCRDSCIYCCIYVYKANSVNINFNFKIQGSFNTDRCYPLYFIFLVHGELSITANDFSNCGRVGAIYAFNKPWAGGSSSEFPPGKTKVNILKLTIEGLFNNNLNFGTPSIYIRDCELNAGDISINGYFERGICAQKSQINILNLKISLTDISKDYGITLSENCEVNIKTLSVSNCYHGIYISQDCTVNISNCSTMNCNQSLYSYASNLIIDNSSLNQAPSSKQPNVLLTLDCNWTANNYITKLSNTTINGYNTRVVTIGYLRNVELNNCRVSSPDNTQGLHAYGGAEITIDGGDYRSVNNKPYPANIIAGDNKTRIRLKNNPQGGTIAWHNGIIIKE